MTRRGLLRATAAGAVAGGVLAAGWVRRGGPTRTTRDDGPRAPAGLEDAGTFDLVVTDTPFGPEDARNVTDRATVPLAAKTHFELVNKLSVHRYEGEVRTEDGFVEVALEVFAHGARKRSMVLRAREDLGLGQLWLGRDYVHWAAGPARFPDIAAAQPFYDEVWCATPETADAGGAVVREESLGYAYETPDGLLGLPLPGGYRYTFVWSTQPDNVGRDYRVAWSRDGESLVETVESVFLVPGGVGLFYPVPTASYLWSDALAFASPKPAAWACCEAGLS